MTLPRYRRRLLPDQPVAPPGGPGRLLAWGRRLPWMPLWGVPLAAILAAVLVFGLDAWLNDSHEPTPASVEVAIKAGPMSTGSLEAASGHGPAARTQPPTASPPPAVPAAPAVPGREGEQADVVAPPPGAAPNEASESPHNAAQPVEPQRNASLLPVPEARTIQHPVAEPAITAALQPATVLSPAEIEALLAQGEKRLVGGELAAARLYFERVALSGDRRGALGMARTFDDSVLARLPVIGQHADAAAARMWYGRALLQPPGR